MTTTTMEPAVVTLCWAADAPARARTNHPDTERPTQEELQDGQIAAEDGLNDLERQLEELASLCRTLGRDVNASGVDLAIAFRVVEDRLDGIRFQLSEENERIVALANLAAWYHRTVQAQEPAEVSR